MKIMINLLTFRVVIRCGVAFVSDIQKSLQVNSEIRQIHGKTQI